MFTPAYSMINNGNNPQSLPEQVPVFAFTIQQFTSLFSSDICKEDVTCTSGIPFTSKVLSLVSLWNLKKSPGSILSNYNYKYLENFPCITMEVMYRERSE